MDGAQLDVYLLSLPWLRAGIELEGGSGRGNFGASGLRLGYGMAGATAGVQLAGAVTPFVDARLVGGFMTGSVDAVVAPQMVVHTDAATYVYGWGVDGGIELYAVGRAYLSLALGWVHTRYRGVDVTTLATRAPAYKDIPDDSLTFKLGLGF
jgi:hypothetical protein